MSPESRLLARLSDICCMNKHSISILNRTLYFLFCIITVETVLSFKNNPPAFAMDV
jgi:hypothetical protein